jgi:hypothetical protein
MFPLVHPDRANPLELFQIWLNLPSADKMADPHFSMMWRDSVPIVETTDDRGASATVTVVAGRFGERRPSSPPPRSWAARPDADVAIWTLRLDPGARCTLPAAATGTHRSLYFFRGSRLRVGRQQVPPDHVAELRADVRAELENGPVEAQALLLQGRPIGVHRRWRSPAGRHAGIPVRRKPSIPALRARGTGGLKPGAGAPDAQRRGAAVGFSV